MADPKQLDEIYDNEPTPVVPGGTRRPSERLDLKRSKTETDRRAAGASTCLSGLCTQAALVAGDMGRQGLAHKRNWMLLTYSQADGVLSYSLTVSLMRAMASSTACSGLMPSVTTRCAASGQTSP